MELWDNWAAQSLGKGWPIELQGRMVEGWRARQLKQLERLEAQCKRATRRAVDHLKTSATLKGESSLLWSPLTLFLD